MQDPATSFSSPYSLSTSGDRVPEPQIAACDRRDADLSLIPWLFSAAYRTQHVERWHSLLASTIYVMVYKCSDCQVLLWL